MTSPLRHVHAAFCTLVVAAGLLGGCAFAGSPGAAPDLGLEALVNDEPGVTTLPGGSLLVVHVAGRTYGVVAFGVPESWGAGAIEPLELGNWTTNAVRQAVDPSALPPTLASREGLVVEAYAGDGFACTARIGTLSLLRRSWMFSDDDEVGNVPSDRFDQARAEDVWEQTDETLLVGELDALTGACDDAVLASPRSLPAPIVFVRREPSSLGPEPRAAAAAAFAARPTVRDFERDRRQAPEAERPLPAEPWIGVWGDVTSDRTLVTASSYGACGAETPTLLLILDGDDPALPVVSEQVDAWDDPALLLDLDADGLLDAITDDAVIFDPSTPRARLVNAAPANPPCPC